MPPREVGVWVGIWLPAARRSLQRSKGFQGLREVGTSRVKEEHALLFAAAVARIWGRILHFPQWQWKWLSGADSLANWALLSCLEGCGNFSVLGDLKEGWPCRT